MVYLRYIYYRLFKGTHIHPSVVIEKNVYIGQNCVIGYQAEHKKFWGKKTGYKVVIKSGTIITGCCTIDAGTVNDTVIGENCFIMKGSYLAHDVVLGDNVVICPNSTVIGHCVLNDFSNIGASSVIHQRKEIPKNVLIGAGSVVVINSILKSNSVYAGVPVKFLRSNERK